MIDYLKSNLQFLALLLVWLVVGMYGGVLIYGVLPLSLLLMKQKEMYQELFLGFWLMLILSDSRHEVLSFSINSKNIYIVLLTVFLFFDTRAFAPVNTFYQKFISFFAIAFLCLFFSETPGSAFQKTLSYLFLLMIVPNYVSRGVRERGEIFFKNLIFFGTLILLIGFVLRFLSPAAVTFEGRYSGILGNPNGLGLFSLMFFLVYSIILSYYPGLFTTFEKGLIYAAILGSVILCGSRSVLFSILIFFLFQYSFRVSPLLGFITFISVLLVYQFVTDNIDKIVMTLGLQDYFRLETFKGGSGRIIAWKFAWSNIQENFYLGKGFTYTEYLFQKYYNQLSMLGHQGNAHNSFLTFWLDTGLVGLLLYLWGFLTSFFQAARNCVLAIPVLYSILFSVYFESWLTASLNPFTIQLFIMLTIMTSAEINRKTIPGTLPVH